MIQQCPECGEDFYPEINYNFDNLPDQFIGSKLDTIVYCSRECKTRFHNRKYYQANKAAIIANVLRRRKEKRDAQ